MIKVRKRNGQIVDFNKEKIANAIGKANLQVPENARFSEKLIQRIASNVEANIDSYLTDDPEFIADVEYIQEQVINNILRYEVNEEYPVAKEYITYRYSRNLVREQNTTDESILSLVRYNNKYVMEENSNKDAYLASTQRDLIAGEVSKDLTKRLLLPKDIVKAHEDGIIHFHDADYFLQPIINCCLIDMGNMLDNGTVMNGKLIESPKSFRVACTIMTQIIAAVASSQYGGQSVDIRHLGKYLRKSRDKFDKQIRESSHGKIDEETIKSIVDDMIDKELKAGVQVIDYQLNSLMTTNGQSPFITIFLNLKPDDPYIEEVAQIIEAILNQRYQGIKNEYGVYITPAFPKLIYVLDEHNNLTGGKYDYLTHLAAKCTAKRMYPDYISAKIMRQNYEGNVFSPMGCRSALSPWKDENGNYKFEGRFNKGVVSINLPQIGIIANGDMDKFWELFDERLEICHRALYLRYKALRGTKAKSSPIHWMYGALARLNAEDTIDDLLVGGYSTLSLGYIGVYELSIAMLGKSHTSKEGKEFTLKVLQHMKDKVVEWNKEENLGYALYGTPSESLCYRFAKIDKEKFGDIKDITDKGYYTNSYHIDVREEIDAFSKFEFEAPYQNISTGGCISYVEIPNMKNNLSAVEALIKFIYDHILYGEFNTKSDYCGNCGFDGEIVIKDGDWECPNCGCRDHTKLTVVRRTCGYLGSNFWNEGKTKEINSRVLHL